MRRNVMHMTPLTRVASVIALVAANVVSAHSQAITSHIAHLPARITLIPARPRESKSAQLLATGALLLLLISSIGADSATHAYSMRDSTHFVVPSLMASVTPIAADLSIAFAPRAFETGVAFPRWSTDGYGATDNGWHTGLGEIQQQAGAEWIEMMIQFYQSDPGSTYVHAGPTTPSPESVAEGVRAAHQMGLRVFIVPLLGVLNGQPWGGAIHFGGAAQTSAWFHSYWNAIEPYLQAAAETGADQFAIGTELSALETAGDGYWHTLIASAHATFPGQLTYDMNWSTLGSEPRRWMSDARLSYLGVSEYAPITNGPWALSTDQIASVWQQRFLPDLNRLSADAGKQVILSEIGYRNARDALYQPWNHTSLAPRDPQVQAAAYAAALRTVYASPSIAGIFWWAWSVEPFEPNDLPAARVLRTYYGFYTLASGLPERHGVHGTHES